MKVSFRPKQIIGLLVILNILILSLVVFLLLEIKKNEVLNLAVDMAPLALPLLSEDIKRIDISSRAYIIYDPQARTVVSGKNEKLRFSPASSTKIMTAIIALEEYNLEDVITATGLDKVKGSTMKLREGETISVENVLYGLLLPSGNDAAYIIASVYEGGESGFVARMNEKAKELNLVNTGFVDSSGYSDDNYTTAYDLARLASYALKNPKFSAIVSTKNKTVTDISGKIIHELSNLNELLGVDGVSGVKTGFSEEALGVLVSSVDHEGRTYIVVVLGSDDRFFDTKNIIERAVEKITLISY
ncbi:MAG: hypothetical protein A2868_04070 [Candidatus Levybacteria bacterium RIFCSPHIGHO2_01_FULL_40_15b]|nr:MAG: hypothetical protein A2868_04070 [Candidatus Levybacteria bacterium RIFCSPHIGHO2_01_FULL_40_15b]